MRTNRTGIISVALVAATLGLRAQTITWGTTQTISGASDVVNLGTLLGTWAPADANAASYPVNGVTFSPSSLPDFSTSGFTTSISNAGSPGTASVNYNTLMEYLEYGPAYTNPNYSTASITWGGMVPGDTYEVELWTEDNRAGYDFSQSEYVIGGTTYGTDMGGPLNIFQPNIGGIGKFITGTFVAGSGLETIGFAPFSSEANTSVSQINLFQVRDISVPEPSTIGLTAVGLLLARGLRRSRA